jgi:hypothetical protein
MALLHELIDDLSPSETRRAADWLHCPLHNRRKDVISLYEFLCEAGEGSSPEAQFAAAFGAESYDPSRHRQVEHQLLKRLESFMAWDRYQRDDFATDKFLISAYRARGLEDHRRTRLKRYRPGNTIGDERMSFDYFHASEQYDLDLTASRGGRVDYLSTEHALEKYLLALRLRQTCITLEHQRLHKTGDGYEVPRLEETLAAAASKTYQKAPFIRLFYLVAQLQIKDPTVADPIFAQLTTLLVETGFQASAEDQRHLLLLAINYGLRRANTGHDPSFENTFRLYRLGLENKMIYDRGLLSIFSFNNILAIALRLGEKKFAAEFLDSHQDLLIEKRGAEVLALGRARLALSNGQDGEALHHLQQADFRDFIHHLTARVMQLKVYFRQDSYTLVQSHISSTRKLLTRRRGIGYHLQNYRNIFAYANAVLRLGPGDQAAAEQLKAKIKKTEPCTERPWLLEQIEEYLRR